MFLHRDSAFIFLPNPTPAPSPSLAPLDVTVALGSLSSLSDATTASQYFSQRRGRRDAAVA